MKRFLIASLLLILVMMSTSLAHAQSQGQEFLDMQVFYNFDWIQDGIQLPVHYMSFEWSTSSYYGNFYPTDWYASPSLEGYVTTGLTDWRIYGSTPDWVNNWRKKTDKNSAGMNIRIIDVDADASYGAVCFQALACFKTNSYSRQGTKGVYHWSNSILKVQFSQLAGGTVSPQFKGSIITHELGHVFGLADRYVGMGNSSTCRYPDETTIMDRWVLSSNGNYEPCAGINRTRPQSIDQQRINKYFEEGGYVQPPSGGWLAKSGSNFYSRWYDEAWNDFLMRHELEKNEGGTWVKKASGTHFRDNGTHRIREERTLSTNDSSGSGSYNVSQYGAGSYRICAFPVMGRIEVQGTVQEVKGVRRCTNSLSWP